MINNKVDNDQQWNYSTVNTNWWKINVIATRTSDIECGGGTPNHESSLNIFLLPKLL